jgi:hypothetical protein
VRVDDLHGPDGPAVELCDKVLAIRAHQRQLVRPVGVTERFGLIWIVAGRRHDLRLPVPVIEQRHIRKRHRAQYYSRVERYSAGPLATE